ncbi:DUF1684 domain-containing protein [Fodinibius salsisoli]|uniref:DUF1684 domain-containing protein n=1 Tax=Fodinibius salsisoli TaxID=2820877 RepID=A0ABT3PQY9_9BACT|nr:DUF1684 domain-containing protein [Fodinibius salsisoli]MCW9708279.1 DUF1684 domain-containing protein [Fodinibius salsisoli]
MLSSLLIFSCGINEDQISEKKHQQQINQWHEERIADLEEKDSWLSLAGLHKLEDGTNTLGSDSSNTIIFPPVAAPDIGTITVSDSSFVFTVEPGVTVTKNGLKVSSPQELQTDAKGTATILKQGRFLWHLIERRNATYVRIKDINHPNFDSFTGIERFPVSRHWRIKATYHPFDTPKAITIPDVLGEGLQDSLYGELRFTLNGQDYTLSPLGNPEAEAEFFIIFGDQTNGESTYSGGRYLYANTPANDNITYIDFNKAYNPPCVFTSFATCPLPPAQNRLDINIEAGEKMYQATTK